MAQHPPSSDATADSPEPAAGTSKYHDDRPPEPLDPLDRDAVMDGLDQSRRGETAPDEVIAALYRRAGL